ncbi:MAG TPA: glycerophosphodiester phosphodiesterase [Acidimicrobiia bacterium]
MLILAHRGACRAAPENTVAAFREAAAQGADGVELDVHRSADGELVVHLDAEVPGIGVLGEHPAADIRAALPSVPTLAEALDACEGMLVNVEVKNLPGDADYDPDDRVAAAVVGLLHARGGRDDVLVSSFNLASIDRVRELDGGLPTAFLTLVGFDPLDAVAVVADRGHAALHPDVRSLVGPVAGATAERAHAAGVAVNAWTVNLPEEVRRLAAAGVDAVITDVPDLARAALAGSDR